MSDAFLLGAGFSMAIDSLAMPSTDALGERALAVQRRIHDLGVEQHSNTCDGLSCDRPMLRDGKVPAPSFEVWLSRLAEDQPYLLEPENQRNHAFFRELSGVVAMEVEGATARACDDSEPPLWLQKLVTAWHERRSNVTTFNYDTLVEATVDWLRFPMPNDDNAKITYKSIGPGVLPFWTVMWNGLRLEPTETFTYWKLHGSVHWYWDPTTRSAESMVEIGLPARWRDGRDQTYDRDRRAPGKEPVIIPPIVAKTSFFANPVIRHLWRKAFESVRAASRVFVIGYSLPEVDLLVHAMLSEAIREAEVWVVDPDPEVVDRVRSLGCRHVHTDFTGERGTLARFTEWYA
jgi:hypothetical protein